MVVNGWPTRWIKPGLLIASADNCFVWVEDFVEAQKLLDRQLQSDWPALLQKLLILAHPLQGEITGAMRGLSYYWSASQTEFATDIVFDNAQSLQRLYPHFLLHESAVSKVRTSCAFWEKRSIKVLAKCLQILKAR